MGFFGKLFKRQQPQIPSQDRENELNTIIDLAIEVMANPEYESTEEIIRQIAGITKDETLAWELYCFIPAVYCRFIIKKVTYSDEFITMFPDGSRVTNLLSNQRTYQAIQDTVRSKFRGNMSDEQIQHIMYQSAELNAINNALHNGSALGDLMLGPMVLIAPEKDS
ncbi:hypothetical protein [Paenibacillus fonticola]|uniref:hypothetical protein n=1 Tax=Paenibacillus fonticola TaxID=379896 RepID=UPI0003657D08|nr:hypothetical protein [Paenibacillus fonticola]